MNKTKDELVDGGYLPMYELDDSGMVAKTICTVPRKPQIEQLNEIAAEGAIEPDGWVRGYNDQMLPVLNGVPITLIETNAPEDVRREGAESCQEYDLDDSLGIVEIHRAGRHPTNLSKIKVNE